MYFTIYYKGNDFSDKLLEEAIQEVLNEGHYIYYSNNEVSQELTTKLTSIFEAQSIVCANNPTPLFSADVVLILENKPREKYEIHDNVLFPFEERYV